MFAGGDAHDGFTPRVGSNGGDDDSSRRALSPPPPADRWRYYSCLGLTPRASTHDVRRAFLELSQRYHTDKHATATAATQAAMGARFRELQEAYEVLMDRRRRAAYDAAGAAGVAALALVPASALHDQHRIAQYVQFLDKAQRLRELATATSTSTDVVVMYNTTVLAALLWRVLTRHGNVSQHRAVTAPQVRAGEHDTPTVTTTRARPADDDHNGMSAVQHPGSNADDESVAAAPDGGDDEATSETMADDGAMRIEGAPMQLAEMEVNGERQLVVLLPAEAQQRLRHMLHAQAAKQQQQQQRQDENEASSSNSSSDMSSTGDAVIHATHRPPSGRNGWLLLQRVLDATLLPRRVRASHSFRHALSPQTELQLRTWASSSSSSGGSGSSDTAVGVRTRLQHRGRVTSTTLQLTTSPQQLKVAVERERALGLLATLRTRLVLCNGWRPLTKMYMTLQTSLSRRSVLHNTLCLSWLASGGYWQGTLVRAVAASASQQWLLRIGADVFNAVVRTESTTTFGVRRRRDSTRKPAAAAHAAGGGGDDDNDKTSGPRGDKDGRNKRNDNDDDNDEDDNDEDDGGVYAYATDEAMANGQATSSTTTPPLPSSSSVPLWLQRMRVTEAMQLTHAPFSAATTLRYELWCRRSALQRYGVAWQSTLLCPRLAWTRHDGTRVHVGATAADAVMLHEVWLLYQRGNNRVSLPVSLFVTTRWATAVAWVVTPFACYRVAQLLYRARVRRAARHYYVTRRRAHVAAVDVARAVAMREQAAVEAAVLRARAAEERRGGLVIVNARYGVLSPRFVDTTATDATAHARTPWWWRWWSRGRRPQRTTATTTTTATRTTKDEDEDARGLVADADIDLTLDVTLALQNLVHDSALTLPRGSKSSLVGFCDPDPYTPERKQLKVTYRFQNVMHSAVFADEDEVQLPRREHRV